MATIIKEILTDNSATAAESLLLVAKRTLIGDCAPASIDVYAP